MCEVINRNIKKIVKLGVISEKLGFPKSGLIWRKKCKKWNIVPKSVNLRINWKNKNNYSKRVLKKVGKNWKKNKNLK